MKRLIPWLPVLCFLGGCNVIAGLLGRSGTETGPAELKRFTTQQEFEDYFRSQLTAQSENSSPAIRPPTDEVATLEDGAADAVGGDLGAAPGALTGGTGDDAGRSDDFSGTTTQEIGVDEADVVKTDGQYLYVIRSEYVYDDPDYQSSLQIIRVAPGVLERVAEVPLEGYGREIYLHGDRVIALTETYGNFYYFSDVLAVDVDGANGSGVTVTDAVEVGGVEPTTGDGADAAPPTDADDSSLIAPDPGIPDNGDFQYERPRTIVTVLDVTDHGQPTMLARTRFDGTQASSRMIDGRLYLVLANYQHYYVDIFPALGRPAFAAPQIDPSTVLPHYTHVSSDGTETSGEVLSWEDVYRPTVPDGFGVVTILGYDASGSAGFRAVGVVAEPGLIYASTRALYLSNTDYTFDGAARSSTDLYKFAYEGDSVDLKSVGRVPGRVLNQYSMGEHNDFLRVATTVDRTFDILGGSTAGFNNVYVLADSNGNLDVVGRVENIAPNETIQSARFIGDRGYLVTFEQIDPLFTMDLSDPTAPQLVGELKVPGFSTFLVPMDENHLLAVGQYIPDSTGGEIFFQPWGVQLSIFDVSDFTSPQLMHQAVIGDETGAYSEALYNPKAFTYFAERGMVALPISIYESLPFDFLGEPAPPIDFVEEGSSTSGPEVDRSGATVPAQAADGSGSDGSSGGADPSMGDEPIDVVPYVPGGFEGVLVYDVSPDGGIQEHRRISTRFEDAGYYYASFNRGVFIGDMVCAVTDNGVHVVSLADPTSDPSALLLRDPVSLVTEPSGDETTLLDDGTAKPDIDPSVDVSTAEVDGSTTTPVDGPRR